MCLRWRRGREPRLGAHGGEHRTAGGVRRAGRGAALPRGAAPDGAADRLAREPADAFAARSAPAIRTGSGYAVSLVALAGGIRRMGTWFVDDLRAPRTVTSATVQALEITNWPLEPIAAGPARQSGVCATRNVRGPGPLAPLNYA